MQSIAPWSILLDIFNFKSVTYIQIILAINILLYDKTIISAMDFNVIGPETQAQVLNSAACAQLNTLKIDVRHLEGIVPSLKEMQQHSGKLVKDYH